MSEDYKRLGAEVSIRRHRLGLTQEDICDAGGPSHQTLRRLEHGTPGPYRASTINTLEKTLQWQAGTIAAILNGQDWNNPDDLIKEKLQKSATVAALPDRAIYGLAIARLTASPHPDAADALRALARLL